MSLRFHRDHPYRFISAESDLTTFSERTQHHSTDYGQDRLLFTADSRPSFIERLYQEAVQNPVVVLRQLDLFRLVRGLSRSEVKAVGTGEKLYVQ